MTKYDLPNDCLDDRLGIVGTSGAGKTFTAKGAVERLLKMGARVCIPDALGIWWGLRSSADGKKAGYPVTVFGGKHADVDINEHHGVAVARLIAKTNVSAVIDISEFPSMAARRRFMTAFCETIYEFNKEPLHLIFDEADLWAPQRPQPEALTLLNRMDEIVRRGRVRGFIPWLISQRPAVIHKDVLSQVDTLIAMKLTSSQDRDALAGWIEGQADREVWKEIRTALPTLPRGDGYIWAPAHSILKRVTFPMIETFDSSRTPKRGERIAGPSKLATVDLSAIKDQLASIQVTIDKDDPERLHGEIEKLKAELKTKTGSKAINVSTPGTHDAGVILGYDKAVKDMGPYFKIMQRDMNTILNGLNAKIGALNKTSLSAIGSALTDIIENWPTAPAIPEMKDVVGSASIHQGHPVNIAGRTHQTFKGARAEAAAKDITPIGSHGGTNIGKLGGAELRFLNILAMLNPSYLTKREWAILAIMKHSGGTCGTYISRLRSGGMLDEEGGEIRCSAAGLQAVRQMPDVDISSPKLLEKWKSEFGGGAAKIIDELYAAYPSSMHKANIADKTGMQASGGTFGTYISRLKSAGLIEPDGKTKWKLATILATGEPGDRP